jgi:5-methylcytosine-specific restriction endonuclease McrA
MQDVTRRKEPELHGRARLALLAQVRREEPNCWLCGYPIDLSLNAQTDPMGSTVDEIIPRSRAADKVRAAQTRSNLHHAHRECNTARKNDLVTEERSSRDW